MDQHDTSQDSTDAETDGDADNPAGSTLPLARRTVLKGALTTPLITGGIPVVSGEVGAQESSDGDWPQYQFDTGNTGHNPDGTGPTTGVTSRWNPFSTGGRVTSPTVMDGTVYAGSGDGTVYAVNADDGSQKWTFGTGGTVRAPAVESGTVYIGSQGGHVYALNASDGTKQWEWPFPKGGASGAPTVANGTVFAPGADDRFFALNADDGSELWRVFTEECAGGQVRTPAVVDGVVYITEDCGKTWALNASDGTVQWKFDDGSFRGQGSPPTVADGTVYFGTLKADSPEGNKLFAIDAATGTEQWRFKFTPEGDVNSSPAIANGTVFFGSDNGTVYALDASDGTKAWEFSTGGAVMSSPAVVSGVVYIASDDGNLYLLDVSSGDEIDQFSTGGEPGSSPAVANGNVYIGSRDGNLYGLEGVNGDGATNTPPTAAFDFTPEDPVVGEEVTFDPSASSDPDGSISTYEWDFDGDGTFDVTFESAEEFAEPLLEAGEIPVTLRVTDDDGSTDKVTKTVSVSSNLKNVRIVQTVENTRLVDATEEDADPIVTVPDPDLVEDRFASVRFELTNEYPEFIPDKLTVQIEYTGVDHSGEPFTVNKSTLEAIDGGYPSFKLDSNLEEVEVTLEGEELRDTNSGDVPQNGQSIVTDVPELDVGFVGIEGLGGTENVGTLQRYDLGDNKVETLSDSIVAQAAEALQRWYPTPRVNFYRHDSILNAEATQSADMFDARNVLDEELPVSTESSPDGIVRSIDTIGEIITPEDLTIESFDVTIAVVPNGYFETYDEGGNAGEHRTGRGVGGDPNYQPPLSALVEEESDVTEEIRDNTVVHEAGHHFLGEPYDDELAEQNPDIEDPGSPTTLYVQSTRSIDRGLTIDIENDGNKIDTVQTDQRDGTKSVTTSESFSSIGKITISDTPVGTIKISDGNGKVFASLNNKRFIEDFDHHARRGGIDQPKLKSTVYQIETGEYNPDKFGIEKPSIMSGQSGGGGIDSKAYQIFIDNEFSPTPPEGSNFVDTTMWRFEGSVDEVTDPVVKGIKTAGGVITDVGSNVANAVETNVIDPVGNVLNSQCVPVGHSVISQNGKVEIDENIFVGHIPLLEETYKIAFEINGTETTITPHTELLFDAVSGIPDNGFERVPDQRRRALNEKLDAIEKQMDRKAFRGAKQNLKNDFRDKIEKWLKDEYDAAANEFTKQEMLDLVDDMLSRLETLAEEDSS